MKLLFPIFVKLLFFSFSLSDSFVWKSANSDGLEQQKVCDPHGWEQVPSISTHCTPQLFCDTYVDSSAGPAPVYRVQVGGEKPLKLHQVKVSLAGD